MKSRQSGVSLTGAIMVMAFLALVGLFAAKLLPAYLDYFAVQTVLKAMENAGETKANVKEIRRAFDRRNLIANVATMRGEDLEIGKEGGEPVVTATWSVKVPVVGNFSACLDFSISTTK